MSGIIFSIRHSNQAVKAQAIDRASCIGQQCNIMVHRSITKGTLEKCIDDMTGAKKELANLSVGTGESWVTEMNNDQLRDLVEMRTEIVERI